MSINAALLGDLKKEKKKSFLKHFQLSDASGVVMLWYVLKGGLTLGRTSHECQILLYSRLLKHIFMFWKRFIL